MEKAGYSVEREYYINDAGNQIDNLAKSIEVRYFEAIDEEKDMPEDGYRGQDIIDLAKGLVDSHGRTFFEMDEAERLTKV